MKRQNGSSVDNHEAIRLPFTLRVIGENNHADLDSCRSSRSDTNLPIACRSGGFDLRRVGRHVGAGGNAAFLVRPRLTARGSSARQQSVMAIRLRRAHRAIHPIRATQLFKIPVCMRSTLPRSLNACDPRSGALLASFKMPGSIKSGATPVGSMVFVGSGNTNDGTGSGVHAFSLPHPPLYPTVESGWNCVSESFPENSDSGEQRTAASRNANGRRRSRGFREQRLVIGSGIEVSVLLPRHATRSSNRPR